MYRLVRAQRLTRRGDLERVRREGKRVRVGAVELRVCASPLAVARVGWIVPKYKHGSVARNLVKRRVREVVRLEYLPVLAPCDVVIRALPMAYDQSWEALRADLRKALRRLPLAGAAASPAAATASPASAPSAAAAVPDTVTAAPETGDPAPPSDAVPPGAAADR